MKEEDYQIEQQEPGSPLIELKGITKVYGKGQAELHALRGIDLCVYERDFVAVMGPSGCGKSTCMNVLGCLDTPTSGRYLFKGVDIAGLTRNQRALLRRHYLGFVFQGFNLLYRGIHHTRRRDVAREALEAVGLSGWEHHTPAELSGGQQQRVAIARAIATAPSVLLADEPTGNLDSIRSKEIMELLSSLNTDRGITVMMVTHEPDMAEYASRTVRFRDGLIASDSRGSEVTQ
jgi:putative ABC transport system ATP-binding protein